MKNLLLKLSFLFNRREKRKVLSLFIFTTIGAVLETIGISLIFPYISLLQDPTIIQRKKFLNVFFIWYGAKSTREFLIMIGLTLLVFYLVKNFISIAVVKTQVYFAENLQIGISKSLFSRYLKSPYTFHLQRNSAELQKNANHEVTMLCNYVVLPLLFIVSDTITIILILTLLLTISFYPTLFVSITMTTLAVIFLKYYRTTNEKEGKAQQKHYEEMVKWFNQGLGGIKETKILHREDFFIDQYFTHAKGYSKALTSLKFNQQLPRTFLETIAVSLMLGMLLIMLLQNRDISLLIPILALFAMAAFRLMPSINRIVNMLTYLRYYRPSLDVIYRDLSSIQEVESFNLTEEMDEKPLTFLTQIDLKKVTYRYPETDQNALTEISLSIPKGASVAFVGSSGAGKTTLADLILGLLTPISGKILVDGQEIKNQISTWQKKIGYIPQSIYLCDDTIRRNIAYALPDNRINDQSVWSAVRMAQLEEFIKKAPRGLDTNIGEDGIRISGGERQRIGIARALYHNPDILVLDEATSSLDYETEADITSAIDSLKGKRTLIIIAHRISTIQQCDLIFWLDKKRPIENISYGDLLNRIKKSNQSLSEALV